MILDDIAFRHLLAKGEEIKYVARHHFFVRYPKLLKPLFIGVAMPIAGYLLFPPFYLLWAAILILGIIIFIYECNKWFLDAWIITDMAIIDHEWNSFFDKSTTRIEFQSVEGVSTEVKGFWGAILGFGDIQVQHVSSAPVVLSNVSLPRKVERQILLNHQECLRKQNFTDQNQLKDLLTNLLRSNMK